MGQKRLNFSALLGIENELLERIDSIFVLSKSKKRVISMCACKLKTLFICLCVALTVASFYFNE